jgi:hypothetical protein
MIMDFPIIGSLYPDETIPEWLVSNKIPIPYFTGIPLTFTFQDAELPSLDAATKAVSSFLKLTVSDRMAISDIVYTNYLAFVETVGAEDVACKIDRAEDVWRHIKPTQIFVVRRQHKEDSIFIQITAECGWELEHGLQIVYRSGNELVRVSEQDGHLMHCDAYNLPESENVIVKAPPSRKPWWKFWGK